MLFGLTYSAHSLLQLDSGKKVNLGLDLQGGLHMLLGIKAEEAIESKVKSITSGLKHYCNKNDILTDKILFIKDKLSLTILDSDDKIKIIACPRLEASLI